MGDHSGYDNVWTLHRLTEADSFGLGVHHESTVGLVAGIEDGRQPLQMAWR